jgi:PAS domain-containing protein
VPTIAAAVATAGLSLAAADVQLRDRELRFRRLFESWVAGVIVSDLDGNFKEANDASFAS